MIEFNGKQQIEPNKFSSEHIENEVLTLSSKHPYYEVNFERKFQANIYPSNQIFEQPEESLIELKVKQQMEPNMLSSEKIENEVLTINYEHPSSEYHFDRNVFSEKLSRHPDELWSGPLFPPHPTVPLGQNHDGGAGRGILRKPIQGVSQGDPGGADISHNLQHGSRYILLKLVHRGGINGGVSGSWRG